MKPETAPVLLWLQGGPGEPSMFGLFVENGPYVVHEDLTSKYFISVDNIQKTVTAVYHTILFINSMRLLEYFCIFYVYLMLSKQAFPLRQF